MVKQFEQRKRHGRLFDWVMRVRSDSFWLNDIPDVASLPRNTTTLPWTYTRDRLILRGCIDDKALIFPRHLAHGFLEALDYYLATNRTWVDFYGLITDSLLSASGLSVEQLGEQPGPPDARVSECGDRVLAPFNYAFLSLLTWRPAPRSCFEGHEADNWACFSDVCPRNASTWVLPPGMQLCYQAPKYKQCPPVERECFAEP